VKNQQISPLFAFFWHPGQPSPWPFLVSSCLLLPVSSPSFSGLPGPGISFHCGFFALEYFTFTFMSDLASMSSSASTSESTWNTPLFSQMGHWQPHVNLGMEDIFHKGQDWLSFLELPVNICTPFIPWHLIQPLFPTPPKLHTEPHWLLSFPQDLEMRFLEGGKLSHPITCMWHCWKTLASS